MEGRIEGRTEGERATRGEGAGEAQDAMGCGSLGEEGGERMRGRVRETWPPPPPKETTFPRSFCSVRFGLASLSVSFGIPGSAVSTDCGRNYDEQLRCRCQSVEFSLSTSPFFQGEPGRRTNKSWSDTRLWCSASFNGDAMLFPELPLAWMDFGDDEKDDRRDGNFFHWSAARFFIL